jgi:hypothetical protein
MRLFAGLFILLISLHSVAQQSSQGKFAVTLCPLAALDWISFPTIQAGLEYKPGRHFSLYNEFGVEYMPGGADPADTVILHPHGLKAKVELRYYFRSEKYIAFNGFMTSDAHNTGVPYYDTLNPAVAVLRTSSLGVHKNVLGWNVLCGWKKWLGGRFWIDFYVGIGMRYRYIRTVDDQLNSHDHIIQSIDPNIPAMKASTDSQNGWSSAPNLTTSVRLVYRFKLIARLDHRL